MTVCCLLRIRNLGQTNDETMVMKSKKNNLYIRLIVSASALLLGVFAPHIAFGQKKEVRGFVISMVHTATYYDEQTCPEGTNGSRPDVLIRRVMRMVTVAKKPFVSLVVYALMADEMMREILLARLLF